MGNHNSNWKASLIGFVLASCVLGAFAVANGEFIFKINEEDLQKFQLIQTTLDEFHKKCGFYPSTEEGLAKIFSAEQCSLKQSTHSKKYFSKNKNSTIVYFSDKKKYSLVIFRNFRGHHIGRNAVEMQVYHESK